MPASRGDELLDVVAGLEGRIENLVRWARTVRNLGGCSHDVSADGLAVIGEAMLADAYAAKAGWQTCFDLACGLRSGESEAARAPVPSVRSGTSAPHPTISDGDG